MRCFCNCLMLLEFYCVLQSVIGQCSPQGDECPSGLNECCLGTDGSFECCSPTVEKNFWDFMGAGRVFPVFIEMAGIFLIVFCTCCLCHRFCGGHKYKPRETPYRNIQPNQQQQIQTNLPYPIQPPLLSTPASNYPGHTPVSHFAGGPTMAPGTAEQGIYPLAASTLTVHQNFQQQLNWPITNNQQMPSALHSATSYTQNVSVHQSQDKTEEDPPPPYDVAVASGMSARQVPYHPTYQS